MEAARMTAEEQLAIREEHEKKEKAKEKASGWFNPLVYAESRQAYNKALSKAQAKVIKAEQSGYNSHYESSYSTLDDMIEAVVPIYAKHGFSFHGVIEPDEGHTVAGMELRHEAGHQERRTLRFPTPNKPHAMGSWLTYAKRYAFSALTMVCGGDIDDDGNTAEGKAPGEQKKETTKDKVQRKAKAKSPWAPVYAVLKALDVEGDDAKELIRWVGRRIFKPEHNPLDPFKVAEHLDKDEQERLRALLSDSAAAKEQLAEWVQMKKDADELGDAMGGGS